MTRVVIVGAGLGGLRAAEALRATAQAYVQQVKLKRLDERDGNTIDPFRRKAIQEEYSRLLNAPADPAQVAPQAAQGRADRAAQHPQRGRDHRHEEQEQGGEHPAGAAERACDLDALFQSAPHAHRLRYPWRFSQLYSGDGAGRLV